jgi:hypothetical protein
MPNHIPNCQIVIIFASMVLQKIDYVELRANVYVPIESNRPYRFTFWSQKY